VLLDSSLRAIQNHFHKLIRTRAGPLADELELPELTGSEQLEKWFPVPGMCGGFKYWLEGEGDEAKLVTESWSRTTEGSGQRHEITVDGLRLVDEGFV